MSDDRAHDTGKPAAAGAAIRRVVTGHDAQGKAVILEDGPAPVVKTDARRPGYAMTQLWITDTSPAAVGNGPDPTQRPISLAPPPQGSVIRIIDFPPAGLELSNVDPETAASAFSMYGEGKALTSKSAAPARHPFMHRTETIDYAVVLSGQITMLLDDTEVHLKAGDVLIQRGTNHAWTNRSDAPCRMLFVLVDGTFDPTVNQAIQRFDAAGA